MKTATCNSIHPGSTYMYHSAFDRSRSKFNMNFSRSCLSSPLFVSCFLYFVFLFPFHMQRGELCAQTIIPGGNVSGIWTIAGSPYLVQGNIMVPNGQILSIEPGVTISFQGHYKFYIQGCLLAVGTPEDTITFTAVDTTNGWMGLDFDSTPATNDSSRFFYCKLQYGRATGTSPDNNGGAFYFYSFSKAIISNCLISSNSADDLGGGIYCNFYSNPTISNNIIYKNYSYGGGGGINCISSNPTISNNIFASNSSFNTGGGIKCEFDSNPTINNNTFYSNFSFSGGGICCRYSSPAITNNTIENNSCVNTYGKGGGIACFNSSSPTIVNNTIINNTVLTYGGGIYCWDSCKPKLTGNTISNNSASGHGGGIFCREGSHLTLINNTITNNTSSGDGGGIKCDVNSNATLINNINCLSASDKLKNMCNFAHG